MKLDYCNNQLRFIVHLTLLLTSQRGICIPTRCTFFRFFCSKMSHFKKFNKLSMFKLNPNQKRLDLLIFSPVLVHKNRYEEKPKCIISNEHKTKLYVVYCSIL